MSDVAQALGEFLSSPLFNIACGIFGFYIGRRTKHLDELRDQFQKIEKNISELAKTATDYWMRASGVDDDIVEFYIAVDFQQKVVNEVLWLHEEYKIFSKQDLINYHYSLHQVLTKGFSSQRNANNTLRASDITDRFNQYKLYLRAQISRKRRYGLFG
jgi:hypothetical protein